MWAGTLKLSSSCWSWRLETGLKWPFVIMTAGSLAMSLRSASMSVAASLPEGG